MKRIDYFICLVAASGLSYGASAQDITSSTKYLGGRGIRVVMDTIRHDQIEKDLRKRNSVSNNQKIDWKDSAYGSIGTYSSNNDQYMARYDQDGKYIETMRKKEWNDNAPAKLRSAYDQSNYKAQTVIGYWEVTDP